MNRRKILKAVGGGLGAGGLLALSKPVPAWRGVEIDAYCKGYGRATFDVEDGEFAIRNGYRTGEHTYKAYSEHFDIELVPTRTVDGEPAAFDFATEFEDVDEIVVTTASGTRRYLENPFTSGSDGTDLHGPVDGDSSGSEPAYEPIRRVEFRRCTGVVVDVTSTSATARPADVIDLTADDIRLAITFGPWRRSDQELFDAAAGTKHGNGLIEGDGELHLYFPYGDSFLDDPEDVGDPSKFDAQLLVEGADGTTWAGETSLPPIV